MRLIYSPRYVVDMGAHVFPTRKFALTAELLDGVLPFVEPGLASREEILLAHESEWTDKVIECRMSLEDQIRMELPFSPEISAAHRRAVSGTILACRDALECGVGLHIGGGSHHAFADHGEGFCVLNDIACAVAGLIREKKIVRAAVVDLDVHQGNGTAAIFAGQREVFTFSVHQGDIYPEKKIPGSLDIELPAGTGDEDYLRVLKKALPKVLAHGPELVVYQAGIDSFEKDLLGGLKLSPEGLLRRDEMVFDFCRRFGAPVAVTLGGGYAEDVGETARLHARTLRCFVKST